MTTEEAADGWLWEVCSSFAGIGVTISGVEH